MRRICTILCLLCGLALPASAAVKMLLSGGVLRDASGATLAPGSLVALVASTQDNVFGVPTPSSTLQVGATFGGDDVVLAVFPVGPQNTGVDGGFVGMVNFDYAALAIPNLAAGDQLKLYWFPAASLNGNQIKPTASYGAYRTDELKSRSNATWVAPNDSSGGTVELNLLTQAVGVDIDNSLAIAALNVASTIPDVAVTATDSVAAEPSDPGVFTFTRNGSTASTLTVNFTVTGTATAGSDYTSLGTSVTFAAGSATATLAVSPIDDLLVEGGETVILTLANGSGYTVGSPSLATITIQDDDSPSTATSFVTGATLVGLRNDYSGWVGMQIVVGVNPLTVSQLGRIMAPGNTGTHTVKLVRASDGFDVTGGAATVTMGGGTLGQFSYGTLASPVTLSAGATYWLVSQEVDGGDSWYNYFT
ncbi:MAG: Calx-beta domain-containing protein, partial [Opitutaceae bacterium]